MDVTDNNPRPMGSPPPESEAMPPHTREVACPCEPLAAADRHDRLLRTKCQPARRLVYASDVREAKIRELQDAVKNGTYHVTAEQIADTMLRHYLRNALP